MDGVWDKYNEVYGAINSAGGAGRTGGATWFARMNYVFPVGETITMCVGLLQLYLWALAVRFAKSLIPTVN